MLKLKVLLEIECVTKTRLNSHRKYNGCRSNNTTFTKNLTKHDMAIDGGLKKAINPTAKMLGLYKMFCYSLKLAKEDFNNSSSLVKVMK